MAVAAAPPEPTPASAPAKFDPLAIAHLQKDLNRVSARGGVFTIVAQVSVFAVQTLTMIFMARLLTPTDFGLFAMITSVTGFILLFKDVGLSNATIQKSEITQPEVSLLFWINGAVSVCMALATLVLAPLLAWFYHQPRLLPMVMVLSIGFLVAGFAVQHQAIITRQMRFRAIAFSDITSILVSSAVGLSCAALGFSYWSLVYMQVSYFCANTTILWCLSGWRPSAPGWHANARNLLTFGSHITGATVMNYLARNLDNFLIGRFCGPRLLGFYGRAYQLLMLPVYQICVPFKAVAVPALSRLAHDPARYRQMCHNILDNVARISMPAIVYMIGTSDWLVALILGPKWTASGPIFACLGIATLLQPFSSSVAFIMISQGRTRDVFVSQFCAGVMTITAICSGLYWGPIGVAAAISIFELFIRTPYLFYMVGRSGPLRTYDMYVACFAGVGGSIAVLAVVDLLRHYFTFSSPLAGFACTLPPAFLAALAWTLSSSNGRQSLRQMRWFVATVRGRPSEK